MTNLDTNQIQTWVTFEISKANIKFITLLQNLHTVNDY